MTNKDAQIQEDNSFEIGIEQEKEEMELLKNPKLLLDILDEIQKEGVIGEEETSLCLITKIMLRLVKNADPTSSNMIISDETGGGKDFITKAVCKTIIPPGLYFHRTDLSDKTFDYWIPSHGTWDGCVIHIEDPRDEFLQGQSLKVMASGGTKTTKVIEHKAIDQDVKGKPVLIITSLKGMIADEGMRRWDSLRLDISETLTKMVLKAKLEKASGKTNGLANERLRHALRYLLKPKEVVIPYAEQLLEDLPNTLVIRTQINKLLDYIKASAVLHQYNRETNENGQIIANLDDYDMASFVFTHLRNMEACPLNKDESELIKVFKDAFSPLPIRDILSRYNRHGKHWFYDHLDTFKSKRMIQETTQYDEKSKRDVTYYFLTDEYQVGCSLPPSRRLVPGLGTTNFSEENGSKSEAVPIFEEVRTNINKKREERREFVHTSKNGNNYTNKDNNKGESGQYPDVGTTGNSQNETTEEKRQYPDKKQPKIKENLNELKKFIDENRRSGRKIDDDFLEGNKNRFSQGLIEGCLRGGILIKNGNKEYEFIGR